MSESNFKNFEADFEKLLIKMNNNQLGQFLTVLSARNLIYLSDVFFDYNNALRSLNTLFISLSYNCAIFFHGYGRIRDRAHARARDFELALANDRYFVPDLDLARIQALDLDLACVRALDRALDFDRDRDRVRARARTLAQEFKETTLQVAQNIFQNDLGKLSVFNENYDRDFKRFTQNLRKSNANYWAEWFEEIFENNFKLTKYRLRELFSLGKAQFDLTIAETSMLLLERNQGSEFFNETRLILLGDKGSGKTSFARRFQNLDAKMPAEKESTPGVDFYRIQASKINPACTDHTINIWDFAGHAVTHAAHKFFLSDRAVYVIVFRGRQESNNTSINEWLEHITYYADTFANDKIKVYILVNHSDAFITNIDYDPKYDEKFEIESKNWIINLKTDNQQRGLLDKFRKEIVSYIINSQQNRDIPSSILNVKKEIETEFKGISNISKIKIEAIIKKHMPDADTNTVLRILHSYGICFYYDKLKGDNNKVLEATSIVLNPRWVTYAIYRLINFIKNAQKNNPARNDGHIKESEYKTAFTDKTIPDDSYETEDIHKPHIAEHDYQFISALAQTFDLAYKENGLLIFPNCLPENYPQKKKGLGDPTEKD
ncbi:MAG: hypothetical protein LBR56_04350, partial [Sporomusaceae bacterium]|nr:hypothetical protein [Sporomusaceae bacterium]